MLTRTTIDRVVGAALEEDAPWGDLTSEMLILESAAARADLVGPRAGRVQRRRRVLGGVPAH